MNHPVNIGTVTLYQQDVLTLYEAWPSPQVIISDGGYGVSGFRGDARQPSALPDWYRPHIQKWSKYAPAGTTLWFWNTEIGWALVHPLLSEHGWDYVCCHIWNKGLQHVAGNCNLATLTHFPIVTEVCVQYVRRPEFLVQGKKLSLQEWLRYEWERTQLPWSKTNEACGVANAATRKYFAKDHCWYAPPAAIFQQLVGYANQYGAVAGRPYFSREGQTPLTPTEYENLFAKFQGQYGVTNVWDFPPLHNSERVKLPGSSKYAHLNQKPLKLMMRLLETTSNPGEVIWEPFGGLCSGGLACYLSDRIAYGAELDREIFQMAVERLESYRDGLFTTTTDFKGV